MTMLAVADAKLLEVDEYAKSEERSREDIVNEAIDMYLRKKRWNRIFEEGDHLSVKNGITEDVVAEEIRRYREEGKSGDK